MTNFQRIRFVKYALALCGLAIVLVCASISYGQTSTFALKPGPTNRDVSDTDLKRPTVAGLTIRVPWSTLHPRRGVFNFSEIDQNLAQSQRCGYKRVKLIVQTGRDGVSPKWFGGQTHRGAPVPWSPEMLEAYGDLMRELGSRYKYRFYVVHVTAPTWPSAEMHPAPGIESVRGYSDQKMIAAWETAARHVNAAFPTTSAALSISVQRPASRYVDATINKLRLIFGNRLVLQHNALKANTSVIAPHHALLRKYSQLGVRVGFEMACSAYHESDRFGSRDVNDGIAIGKAAGAEFIDTYPPDLKGVK